ncbi:hypothetical protein OJAV_G00162550 [Oryzias javanicus]|uniref:Uncharacterized protein n=1 Tax=Oryzias javanicus TaxID=123683 RepID=A0A437CJL5_ORYJA|nr:hypothetical protein OJAV_G00162550 [Oryzias javanicus]
MVLNDWQRGRIPFFVKPPGPEGDPEDEKLLPVEAPPPDLEENMQEEQTDGLASASVEQEEQQQRKKEQVQKILSNVRQNFGKINVVPEFSEEDLVPVEMPDLDMSDFSGSEAEEDEAEDEKLEEDDGDNDAEKSMAETSGATNSLTETDKEKDEKSSKDVIRELDAKIAKYKHFLDRAKSKRFSAIRIPKALSDKVFTDVKTKQAAAKQAQKKASQTTAVNQKSKKRKAEGDEESLQPRLTSKQKRAMERAQKVKKVGVRYYETHNVKNKNKSRRVPASATKDQRTKRSKQSN